MQRTKSWIVLPIADEGGLLKWRGGVDLDFCSYHGLKVNSEGSSDLERLQGFLRREFMVVLEEIVRWNGKVGTDVILRRRQESLLETDSRQIVTPSEPVILTTASNYCCSWSCSANQESTLASSIASWVHKHVDLRQLRIESSGAASETLVSIIRSEDKHLRGVRLRLPRPDLSDLLGVLFMGTSSLVRVSLHVKILQLSGARSLADYLKKSAIQQLSIEGVEYLIDDKGAILAPDAATNCDENMSFLLLKISTLIADSLRFNRHLRAFRLSGRNRPATYGGQAECQQSFAAMMEANLFLESFRFAWVEPTGRDVDCCSSTRLVRMYLKLNRFGLRRSLLRNHEKAALLKAVDKFNSTGRQLQSGISDLEIMLSLLFQTSKYFRDRIEPLF